MTPAELANVKLVEMAYREAVARMRALGQFPGALPTSTEVSAELEKLGLRMPPAVVLETARRSSVVLGDAMGEPEEPTRKLPAVR